jgi:cell division protein DivIC
MKRVPDWLKNKYAYATVIFFLYVLFLDDMDIFTMVKYNGRLRNLEASKEKLSVDLRESRILLKKLRNSYELENFAREKKFFKKDNEEIFVITYQDL